MMGPSGSYSDPDPDLGDDWKGSLSSGFIDDHGQRLTDVLGDQIPKDREYLTWHHQQIVNDDLQITGDINYWSDSDMARIFADEFTRSRLRTIFSRRSTSARTPSPRCLPALNRIISSMSSSACRRSVTNRCRPPWAAAFMSAPA